MFSFIYLKCLEIRAKFDDLVSEMTVALGQLVHIQAVRAQLYGQAMGLDFGVLSPVKDGDEGKETDDGARTTLCGCTSNSAQGAGSSSEADNITILKCVYCVDDEGKARAALEALKSPGKLDAVDWVDALGGCGMAELRAHSTSIHNILDKVWNQNVANQKTTKKKKNKKTGNAKKQTNVANTAL